MAFASENALSITDVSLRFLAALNSKPPLCRIFSAEFAEKKSSIVASGGGVRNNDVLKKLIADRFGATVSVNTVKEEAATGAALFSAFVAGKISYNNGFSDYISYV